MMRALIVLLLVSLFNTGNLYAVPLADNAGNPSPLNRHNLSSGSSNTIKATSETRICVFCHTPHGASAQSALWNRKNPSTASFPLYSSPTDSLNIDDAAIVGDSQYTNADPAAYPNGATRMCLSCHDGVSAIGEILSSSAPIIMNTSTLGSSTAVVNLATTHPVSFVYNAAVVGYLNTTTGGGLDGRTDYVAPTVVPLDGQQRLQCTTCHDPHEDTRTGTYNLPFWRNYTGTETADYDNTCNDCHRGTDWGTNPIH
jgi:hypothetical protein